MAPPLGAARALTARRGEEDVEKVCRGAREPWARGWGAREPWARGAGSWGAGVCWLPAASPGPRPSRFVSIGSLRRRVKGFGYRCEPAPYAANVL